MDIVIIFASFCISHLCYNNNPNGSVPYNHKYLVLVYLAHLGLEVICYGSVSHFASFQDSGSLYLEQRQRERWSGDR